MFDILHADQLSAIYQAFRFHGLGRATAFASNLLRRAVDRSEVVAIVRFVRDCHAA